MFLEAARDAVHVGLRLLHRHTRLQTRHGTQIMWPPGGRNRLLRPSHRDPDVDGCVVESKAGRQHADDGACAPVQRHRAADNRRIAAEPPSPQPRADHHHIVLALPFLVGGKRAAERRLNAEDRKEVGRDRQPFELLRLADSGQCVRSDPRVARGAEVRRQVLERPVLAPPVGDVGGRALGIRPVAIGVCFPELDETRGIAVRESAPQHRVRDAENGGGGANAERKCERRDTCEPGIAPQHTPAIAKVLREHVEAPVLLKQRKGVRDCAGGVPHDAGRCVPELRVPLAAPCLAPPARNDEAGDSDDCVRKPAHPALWFVVHDAAPILPVLPRRLRRPLTAFRGVFGGPPHFWPRSRESTKKNRVFLRAFFVASCLRGCIGLFDASGMDDATPGKVVDRCAHLRSPRLIGGRSPKASGPASRPARLR